MRFLMKMTFFWFFCRIRFNFDIPGFFCDLFELLDPIRGGGKILHLPKLKKVETKRKVFKH